jgi:hypothetical protein
MRSRHFKAVLIICLTLKPKPEDGFKVKRLAVFSEFCFCNKVLLTFRLPS